MSYKNPTYFWVNEMEAIIIRGNKTEDELQRYVESIKQCYGFKDDEITVVDTMKGAAHKIADDIRNL